MTVTNAARNVLEVTSSTSLAGLGLNTLIKVTLGALVTTLAERRE